MYFKLYKSKIHESVPKNSVSFKIMGAKYPLQIPSDAQLNQKNYNYCAQVGGLIGRAEDGTNCFRKMIYKLDF